MIGVATLRSEPAPEGALIAKTFLVKRSALMGGKFLIQQYLIMIGRVTFLCKKLVEQD